MAHTVTLSDEAYQRLEALAQQQQTTPALLVEAWVAEFASQEPIFHSEDEFMQMLGIGDEDMAWVTREFAEPEPGEEKTQHRGAS